MIRHELDLLRGLPLPEHPELLRSARIYGPRAWWPARQRRRSRHLLIRTLAGVSSPVSHWVCHELHLRKVHDPGATLGNWLQTCVLPDIEADHDACAVSVQRTGQRWVSVVIIAALVKELEG
jgi:hypothetical protein